MKILNFGSLNIDKVYQVDKFVKPGETKGAQSFKTFIGGKGLNQSVAIARAGGEVWHAGMIGDDGTFLKESLERNNVHTEFIRISPIATGHAVIQVDQLGQNCILLYKGANHNLDKEYVDEVLATLEKGDIIVLQNEINNLQYIIQEATRKGLEIVLNPSPVDKVIQEIDMNKVAYLILNEVEGWELAGVEDAEEILVYLIRRYPQLKVVLTLGDKGVWYRDAQIDLKKKSYCVEAVDTTGAGDTFTGFFVSSIAKGKSVDEALVLATKAAAICVTRLGAAEAIPTYEEVKRFKG